MHPFKTASPPTLSLALAVLLLSPFNQVNAALIHGAQQDSLRFQSSGQTRSWLSRVRDGVLQSIWRIEPPKVHCVTQSTIETSRSDGKSIVSARYGGDVVLRFNVSFEAEVRAMADAVNVLFLDVWEFTSTWVDIRLSREVVPSLMNLLPATLQRAHTPLMHDLARTVYESYPSPPPGGITSPQPARGSRPFTHDLRQTPKESNLFFQDYQPLSVILPWMRLLRSLFPTHVRLISVGTSYEGREIPALRVGVHPRNSDKPLGPRKTIIVAGGSHAREWISTSTVNYVAYSFITAYGRDRGLTALLEKFDFVFVPTINPDGYAYTWENDRLWRKNRQQTPLRFCKGFDLDRAFDFQWDSFASANENPCSESFSGEGPFEALEARKFADWARNETTRNNVEFVGFLDLHSYSQQILYPYSYSCVRPPHNLEDLEELGIGLAKAIRLTHGEQYSVTSACHGSVPLDKQEKFDAPNANEVRIETGGGSALDWFYHELGIPYAYQIKLRDTGNYGFLLPKEHIIPTGKEIFNAVHYFADFVSGNKGTADAPAGSSVTEQAKLSHPEALKKSMAGDESLRAHEGRFGGEELPSFTKLRNPTIELRR